MLNLLSVSSSSMSVSSMSWFSAMSCLRSRIKQARLMYDASHASSENRTLHAICVPLETAAFHALLKQSLGVLMRTIHAPAALAQIARLVPWLLAAIQWIMHCAAVICLETKRDRNAAKRALGVHVALTTTACLTWNVTVSLAVLAVSWAAQIGIGHTLLEKKAPSMLNEGGLTVASVTFSVLLAYLPRLHD